MINNVLKEIIINFWEQDIEDYKDRKFKIPELNVKKAISLVWPRRSWKTSLCFLKIKQLVESWLNKRNILYINFEDERLINFNIKDFDTLLKVYFELSWKSTRDKNIYFFFDEIQNVKWWEKFIVRVLNNFDIRIVVTGSSAKMLSKEVDTALRWKNISFEVLPLNFDEFLGFKEESLSEHFEYSIDGWNNYKKLLNEFLMYWTFPEVVLEKNEIIKKSIVKTYYDLIFYKDIVDRFKIRDIANLKKLRKFLTYNFTNLISLKKFADQFKISYPVVLNWYEYFQDSYFGFALKKFNFSIKNVEKSLSKFYLVDNSFFYVNFWQINNLNLSSFFENAVFLEFRKAGFVENENIFYYKDNKFDIDFILFKEWVVIPVQVCWELNEENFKREYGQLEEFIEKFKLEKWYIVLVENKANIIENGRIEVIRIEEMSKIINSKKLGWNK